MSLTVKAYLKQCENANPEIRRFTVDHDVTSSYEYLSKKVAQVFPSLGRPERFTLAWKDADNEMISFSSDEELMEALGSLDENVFRIYVTEKNRNKGTASGAEGEVFHPGVVCDGCEGSIRGPRFKCVECPDYDLCKQCEEKGVHPEHEFVKFRKPVIGRTHQGGFKWRPNIWRGFGHPGWRHWWWQQHNGAPGAQGPWGAHCRFQQQQGEKQGETGEEQQQQPGSQQQQGPEGFGCGGDGARDFMQHVGEQVAELLDPLGIDVDIETSIGGMRRKCHGGRGGRGGPGWRGGRGGPCHRGGKGNKGKGKFPGKGNTCKKEEEASPNKETAEQQKEGEESSTPKAADYMETEMGNAEGGSSGSNEEADWTMVTENAPDGKDDKDSEPSDADDGIASAIAQLQAMGFDDDDGWLTHLVEAKGGNINRVLDTIRINQPQ